MSPARFDLEPLAVLMGCDTSALARRLGVSGSTWKQYRDEGVSEKVADRLAVRAGFNPYNVWPDWGTVECADEKCDGRFVPRRRNHRYCSPLCSNRTRSRAAYRARYADDPDFRAAEVARNQQYRQEAAQALAAGARRRYWENPEHHRAARRERHLRAKAAA